MKIQTRYYGEQEINAEEILSFPGGLPGFEKNKQFILQPFGEAFSVLQSIDERNAAFIVTSPFLFFDHFSVNLSDKVVRQLEIESDEDVSVWVIVTVQTPFSKSTANLKAPVIINTTQKLGKQYISDFSSYSVTEPLAQSKTWKRA
ncbi:flagellar assembly protein FliW [Sporolactobacillus shoreae]|uniref:Flagellar assembly factor FliW n=1 Tax=Sporolactobacillus shoreae TaxID=1465501 RepID=A0A4Z0GHC3_9BACL|nr:flagellar assembly protein FliW [Sporolactobacillus shoreae]TGA95869.1 flagellar assembly protein FliW [Sporolactobacillus shoreae]